jgi:diguanylate cyclase (GGDEF)-like protein
MGRDEVVILYGPDSASAQIRDLTHNRLHAAMAGPVHQSGEVAGGLLVASSRPERRYREPEAETLRTFAQNVSLALTDAHTFEQLNRAAHDTLTGLASRGLFLDRLTEQLSHAGDAALLFIDLDRFKLVNDTLGHAAGDRLLTIAAERIRSQLRPADLAGRFGGDEFAVLLRDVADVAVATAVAERVVQALGEPMPIAGHSLSVGASTGIALASPDAHDPLELLRRADIAMYQAKRKGRCRYEVFTDEMMAEFPEDTMRHG